MRTKKEINIQIGEQIKFARENVCMTQEQLAEKVEVSPQFISDLERGLVGASVATIRRICVALHVSSDQLLFGTKSEDRGAIIAKIGCSLSDKQWNLLEGIVKQIADVFYLKENE